MNPETLSSYRDKPLITDSPVDVIIEFDANHRRYISRKLAKTLSGFSDMWFDSAGKISGMSIYDIEIAVTFGMDFKFTSEIVDLVIIGLYNRDDPIYSQCLRELTIKDLLVLDNTLSIISGNSPHNISVCSEIKGRFLEFEKLYNSKLVQFRQKEKDYTLDIGGISRNFNCTEVSDMVEYIESIDIGKIKTAMCIEGLKFDYVQYVTVNCDIDKLLAIRAMDPNESNKNLSERELGGAHYEYLEIYFAKLYLRKTKR